MTHPSKWNIPTLVEACQSKLGLDAPEDWLPETWVARGYQRNWGDAAVMDDSMEILRKEGPGLEVSYVILCAFLRRPVVISAAAPSWGSF